MTPIRLPEAKMAKARRGRASTWPAYTAVTGESHRISSTRAETVYADPLVPLDTQTGKSNATAPNPHVLPASVYAGSANTSPLPSLRTSCLANANDETRRRKQHEWLRWASLPVNRPCPCCILQRPWGCHRRLFLTTVICRSRTLRRCSCRRPTRIRRCERSNRSLDLAAVAVFRIHRPQYCSTGWDR